MKIICLCFCFYDYTIQLANSLSKTEEVTLMLPNDTPDENLCLINEYVELLLFEKPKKPYISTIYDIKKQIDFINPDVIHLQGQSFVFCLFSPLLTRYPFVSTIHDAKQHIGEEKLLFRLVSSLTIKYSKQIIVHGDKIKQQLITEYNCKKNKLNVIPMGENDVQPFKKYEKKYIKENKNLILFFGRILEYKGLEYLIKAEPIITKEVDGAKIVIAGASEEFKKYEEMMVNRDNFIIHNYRIPYKEGAELFQKCCIVVLPYIEASQSGVIPIAYGFKKPVVATNVGAIPEIIDEGNTGLIVPSKNVNALAKAIVGLLKNEDLRKQMGENGYKKLKNDLSWDNIAKKTIEVYKTAIQEK